MKAGSKLKSAVCAAEAMVVKAGVGSVECGGKPMLADKPAELGEIDPAFSGGSQIGKRYVDADGKWDKYSYVPAYVRRYPFILLASTDERLTLGIDTAANVAGEGARALFQADGKETEVVTQTMDFCSQFHNAFMFTREFSEALKKADLVTDCLLEIEPQPGQRVSLGTFKRIDEEKFKKLPDSTIQEWFKNGYMHACYFLLQSMNNWDVLLVRAGMTVPPR